MKPLASRRWLILSYFSKIDGMACAQHLDDRLPYLADKGITPMLVTGTCGERWSDIFHARVPCFAPSGIRFELGHLRRRNRWWKVVLAPVIVLLLPFYLLERLVIHLDSHWSWFLFAAIRGGMICLRYRPELIYSTGGPASAHLAAALIVQCLKLPWIAEVQDPLVHDDWARTRSALKFHLWLEKLILRKASALVFVTDLARKRAVARTGIEGKSFAIYPGGCERTMGEVQHIRTEVLRFCHFGSLAGSRNPEVFLGALGKLFDEHPEWSRKVEVHFYGSCDRHTKRLIRDFAHPSMLQDHGRVPREAALEAMRASDVLLLIQNTAAYSAETIPSKTYEYLLMRRPILGLIHLNPELEAMLHRDGHFVVDATDEEMVKVRIMEIIRWWESRTEFKRLGFASPTTNQAVQQLVDLSEQILHG